jgi:hypothetical protein
MTIIAEVIGEQGGHADPTLLARLAGVNMTEALKVAAAHSGRALDTAALYRSYLKRYLPRLRACAAPTRGFAGLIEALKAAEVPIGIASSSSLAEIDAVVHALRFGPVLAAIASADEVHIRWPSAGARSRPSLPCERRICRPSYHGCPGVLRRAGYSLTGPCKFRSNSVATGFSAIEHLPFESRASTARMLSVYVPEPLIRLYVPLPPVSL